MTTEHFPELPVSAYFNFSLHEDVKFTVILGKDSCMYVPNIFRNVDKLFVIKRDTIYSQVPTRCNSIQVFIYCKITLHVSGIYRTHHQEYLKL